MNQTEAMRIAEQFLKDYIRKHDDEYRDSDSEELKVQLQCAAKGDTEQEVCIMFGIRQEDDEEDPGLLALAKQAFDALVAAHPELKEVELSYELSA
jgi:hypothetical protein